MVYLNYQKGKLYIRINEIYIISLIILIFTSLVASKSVYQIEEIEVNKNKTIIINSSELYVISKINETGYLGHRIIVSEIIGLLENNIYYASLNENETIEDCEFKEVKPMMEQNNKERMMQDIGPFEVEKGKKAVIKFINLKYGETIEIEAYYISKGFTIGLLIIIIVSIILGIALIVWIVKKCCHKKKE